MGVDKKVDKTVENKGEAPPAFYTAVISDLHLCEEEPPHPKHPLWKKFKTREFFFDETFCDFLKHIQVKANHHPVELVLNGDIFDFDSFMKLPEKPPYKVSWLERCRGLHPEESKSVFKIKNILEDHSAWVQALKEFVLAGNSLVFVVGNHDLELHYPAVQREIINAMVLPDEARARIRFNAWFYISNKDTLIEHGNQYDPYCLCQNPINPLVQKFNRIEVRLPFGNVASRYMINGMGFFNPHVDTNYIMTIREYLHFFFKYLLKDQPLILWTWFWGALITFVQSFSDRLLQALKDPLTVEDRIEDIARNANATPRMVRELRELFAHPATSNPILVARELWLDRAFLVLVAFFGIFQLISFIKLVYSISFYWMFFPLSLFIPFFIFYFQSISSAVTKYKEPNEKVISLSSQITHVKRVIYGHTHIPRHEMIGSVEHFNSGCWSPAFLDVECTKPFGKKTFVWLGPGRSQQREGQLLEFKENHSFQVFRGNDRQKRTNPHIRKAN